MGRPRWSRARIRRRARQQLTAAALTLLAGACTNPVTDLPATMPATANPLPSTAPDGTLATTPTSIVVPATTSPPPEFEATIEEVDPRRLAHSHSEDCPVAPSGVVLISLKHWGFDGRSHDGAIVVARSEGERVVEIFRNLFQLGYPIESVIPIGDLPPGIEDSDPDYNNTSGLHCRRAVGSGRWSEHARGLAIDINPLLNPFTTGDTLWPESSGKYLDRSLGEPGMIVDGDEVVAAFAEQGWLWGGHWRSLKDYQHFSVTGR